MKREVLDLKADLISTKKILKHSTGIDVSKDSLSIFSCKLQEDLEKEFLFREDSSDTEKGFKELHKWIRSIANSDLRPIVVLKATGVYHEGLSEYLYASITLSIMQSGRAKRHTQSLDQRSKTDVLDSKKDSDSQNEDKI